MAIPNTNVANRALNTLATTSPGSVSSWERALAGTGGTGGSLNTAVVAARDAANKPAGGGGGVYNITTTDPGGPVEQFEPTPYPTVLPSLSAQQLGQLAERRMLADMRLKQAQAEAERRTGVLEASALRQRQDADRISRRTVQDFMREAGGKGLARSPMVAGRQVRRAGEDLRQTYGEIDTRLSTEIAALQDLVSRAEDERQFTIGATEQQEIDMRADLERLFPAASMFR